MLRKSGEQKRVVQGEAEGEVEGGRGKGQVERIQRLMTGWTQKRERWICTGWQGREKEMGRMFSRLG